MYESIIIGVVGPPYPHCSLVEFCAFAWLRLCAFGAFIAFGAFSAFGARKIFSWKNKEFKTSLITSFTLLLTSHFCLTIPSASPPPQTHSYFYQVHCITTLVSFVFSTDNFNFKENYVINIKFAKSSRAGGKWTREDFFRKYLTILLFTSDVSIYRSLK